MSDIFDVAWNVVKYDSVVDDYNDYKDRQDTPSDEKHHQLSDWRTYDIHTTLTPEQIENSSSYKPEFKRFKATMHGADSMNPPSKKDLSRFNEEMKERTGSDEDSHPY